MIDSTLVLKVGDPTPCCGEPAARDPIGQSLCSGEHGYTHLCPWCGQLYGGDGEKAGGWGYWTGRTPRKRLRRKSPRITRRTRNP
jgi:hypothetical protein